VALPAPPEPLAHKVSKVTQERLESLAQLALWDPADPLAPLENQEVMVRLASLAKLVSVDLQDLRELVDSPEPLDFQESRDTEVTPVWMELRERAVLLEPRVRLGLPERMEPLDQWAHVVCLAREGALDHLELLVPVVTMACLVLLVPLGLLVLLEHPVSQDLLVLREKLAPLGLVEQRAPRDPVERLAPLDLLDLLELVATLVLMVSLELKDLLVLLVLLVPLVSQAPAAHPDLREQQDLLGLRDSRETLVFLGSKVKLAPRESLALPVPKVPPAQLARREREEREESLALLDHWDHLAREELLVTVVSQVRMVLLVLRGPLATVGFLEWLGRRVPVETPDAQENLACLEPEVSLGDPEMLVLKAKLVQLVLRVRTVAPDLLVLREPADSRESWDSPDQREPTVSLVKPERRDFWAVLV